MKYILFVFILSSGAESAAIDSQVFADSNACDRAKATVEAEFKQMIYTGHVRAVCVPQSSVPSE